MKVWKDKEGKMVEHDEFISRWKEGIQKVTPLQQTKATMFGYTLVYLGILIGLYSTFILKQYWLLTILIGSFVITSVQFLAILQKYFIFTNIEKEVYTNEDKK